MNWLIKREDVNAIYYMKLQRPDVCLSVYTPFFRHDCLTTIKFGTHMRIDLGIVRTKKIDPPQVGPRGDFGGPKIKGPENVMNCRENQ